MMNLLQNIINLDQLSKLQNLNCQSIENLPFNLYAKDKKGKYIQCSDSTAQMAGSNKSDDILQLTDNDLCWSNYALLYRKNDEEVMKTGTFKIIVEPMCDYQNNPFFVTSIKTPLRTRLKKIIGVGVLSIIQKSHPSVIQGRYSLPLQKNKCFSPLVKEKTADYETMNIIDATQNIFPGIHLTDREKECLILTTKGKTAKQTALILGISSRTVEHHLISIKTKLGVFSKRDLIDRILASLIK